VSIDAGVRLGADAGNLPSQKFEAGSQEKFAT
jgi:hypothetical protein